jgi:uncharacterized membrane protein YesL
MDAKHVLKYHLILPGLVLVVLLLAGAPILTAFFVACMAGCLSMMLMMGRDMSASGESHRASNDREPESRDRE